MVKKLKKEFKKRGLFMVGSRGGSRGGPEGGPEGGPGGAYVVF